MQEWFTLEEAANYCRYSYDYFWELVQAGKVYHPARIKHRRGGKSYRFHKSWLDQFLSGGKKEPQDKPRKKKFVHLNLG